MNSTIRYVTRNGEKVLQELIDVPDPFANPAGRQPEAQWVDVPTMSEAGSTDKQPSRS